MPGFIGGERPRRSNGLIFGSQIGYSALNWIVGPDRSGRLIGLSAFMARATNIAAPFALAAGEHGGTTASELLLSLLLTGPWAA